MRQIAIASAAIIAALMSAPTSIARSSQTHQLTFEDRVRAQEAIERVYYSHQIGATKPFEEAVPREVIEKKVRTYLKQSVALAEMWKTPVTAEMLQRETERMSNGTRMPDRLREMYAALDNDPMLILECLARPALVDRLARNFFAFDERIHGQARMDAEILHGELVRGDIDPSVDDPRRTVVEVTRETDANASDAGQGARGHTRRQPDKTIVEPLAPEQFDRWTEKLPGNLGEISSVVDERDEFRVQVVLERETDRARVVSYRIEKRSWEDWWAGVEPGFAETDLATDLLEGEDFLIPGAPALRPPTAGDATRLSPCTPDDTWDNGFLDDMPDPRSDHTAVWTGSLMLVWGGSGGPVKTGWRYDPVTDTWSMMSTASAPSVRSNHTVVWTGSRMIVWGGVEGTISGTGGQYDPATDTWRPTSTTNAPSARVEHTAVWTGSLMVVWGGQDAAALTKTGGRYDPATDTWSMMSTANAPSARAVHTAVWTGSRMIVWGGYAASLPRTGGRYDPTTDTWTATSTTNAPSGRYDATGVWTGSLMVVWGGDVGNNLYLDTGGRYDPATDTWTATSSTNAPSARGNHTAVWTGNLMLIWGGGAYDPITARHYFNMGGRYDPATDSWTQSSTTNAPSARGYHTAVWTGSLMVVWGGSDGNGSTTNSGGRYDAAADFWTPMATTNAPSARYVGYTGVWTGSVMVVWGGIGSGALNTGGRYDPATDSWASTSTASAPTARWGHTAVWTGSVMVVWGGAVSANLNTGGLYDPATDSWASTSTANAPTARWDHTAIWTGNLMIVWGGTLDGYGAINTGGRYDPATDSWASTSTANTPTARWDHTAVWTGSLMVVWGGYDVDFTNTGGRYDPATDTWTPTSTTAAPSARRYHTAVWTGSLMVVWGGYDNSYLNTGGRYDPTIDTWTPMSTANVPSGRYHHTAVWTGNRMVVWGGYGFAESQFFPLDTGGRYDPATDTWTATSSTNAPSARFHHIAVWTGNFMVIWGGNGLASLNSGGRYVLGLGLDDDNDGFTECAGDCDDTNPTIYPGAPQVCDGYNNDCNAPDWPAISGTNEVDTDGDTYSICGGDCAEGTVSVYPAAPQLCDGLNNDCTHPSWPALTVTNEGDDDGDSFTECQGDCNDGSAAVRPGAVETCNSIDDNCNSQVDEDAAGLDSDSDGIHNSCDNCRFAVNPTQTDTDKDRIGNSCDNCITLYNPGQEDGDADQRGNVCDNCPTEANTLQDDSDADRVGDVCDNCIFDQNADQADLDIDLEGDLCDLDDGLILLDMPNPSGVDYQLELGYDSFNVYRGTMGVLRSVGQYTQDPMAVPDAAQFCSETFGSIYDPFGPDTGQIVFYLVTGVGPGGENSLGANSAGGLRPNHNPCP